MSKTPSRIRPFLLAVTLLALGSITFAGWADSIFLRASASRLGTSLPSFTTKAASQIPEKIGVVNPYQDEVEPNDAFETATAISLPAKVTANVYPNADVDFFSFTASAGDRVYAATMTSFDAGGSTNSVIDLLASDGTTVIESDNDDGTFSATSASIAGAVIPADGTYYLRVRNNSVTAQLRPYDLYVNLKNGTPTAEIEPNNTTASATALTSSGWASGTITAISPGESDFFSVSLAAGDTVFLSLDLNPQRAATGWNGRLGFGLFGNPPANQILLANDGNAGSTAGNPASEAFFFTVKEAGTYYVYVDSAVATNLGPDAAYNLSITTFSPEPPTGACTTYTSTDVPVVIPDSAPSSVQSTITVPGNPRIADLDVSINMNHTFMQDVDAQLVSPAGNNNSLFNDIGASTVGNTQTLMDLRFDDEAAIPPSFALTSSWVSKPENLYRLAYYDGENAGGVWTLVLRDDATGDGGTLNSWSITVCEPPASQPETTIFSADFESGDAGFTHSGTQDEWERGLPATVATTTTSPVADFSTCSSGSNCWKTDLDNTYNASSSQDLLSPSIDLTSQTGNIRLKWAQRFQMESATFDHARVVVQQVGNPASARTVWEWMGATMTASVGSPAVNIGASSGWSQMEADISDFAGSNVEVIFHLDSDTTVNFGGWAIDDFAVTTDAPVAVPGTVQFSDAAYTVGEAGPTATVTVTRTDGTDGSVSVDYATVAGGTATGGAACDAGVDFINTNGTINFGDGDSAPKTFEVAICNDVTDEVDETVQLSLSNPTGGATVGTPGTATLTITDDDEPPPAGNVVVNPGNVAYATLGEAVAAINAGTHTGAITVDLFANTTETGSVVLHGSGAGAASYTSLVIRPAVDGVTVAGASAQGRGLIELNGADNVTIDGDNPNSAGINRNLTIQNTAANTVTFTSVIRVVTNITTVNTAENNSLVNLNVIGSSIGNNIASNTSTTGAWNTTFGIFSGPNASGPTTDPTAITSVLTGVGAGASVANLTVANNNVQTAARGISINGSGTAVHAGVQVTGNYIGNAVSGDVDQVTAIGITVNGSSDAIISGNTVYVEGYVASSAAGHGINVGVNSTNTTGATIERNQVNRVWNNNPASWSAYGINVAGVAASAHTVRNNFVSGVINSQAAGTGAFGTTFGAYGIRIASGTGHKVYHNSVNLYGPMAGETSTNLTAAFLVVGTGQTGLDVRNNIFSNQITGGNAAGTRHTAIFLPSGATSAMNLTLNNNIYFQGTDPLSTMAQVGTTFASSIGYQSADFDPSSTTPATNFRSYSSTLSAAGTNDNASLAINPQFVSNTDLHILPTSLAESRGVDVGVTNDIDGDTRPAVPDIGADEITVAGPGVIQFNSTAFTGDEGTTATISVIRSGGTDGTVGVTATVTDGTATGGASCAAGIDYINPGPQVLSFGNGVSLQTFNIQLCTDAVLEPGETVNLTLSDVTGGATIGTNNPATLTIRDVPPPFTGTIDVGTGGTFTSLTNPGGLFEALNEAGLSGNLTVNVTSDLTAETGAVALNQLTEVGAGGYTLTIKPSGAARTISGTAAVNIGLINLNGADRVVFDGSLSGGTDRSLTVINSQTGTSTVFWIRSAGAGNGANSNTIKNTVIHGAGTASAQTTAGILAGSGTTIGGPAEAPNNNNTVMNNWIYSVQNSIYNQGNAGLDQNWTITDNDFGSAVEAEKNRFRGMLMGNANNFVISGNSVLGVTNFTGTTGALSGIQIAFAVTNGTVTNNRISNINNLSASGTGAFGMQLGATPTTNILIANNFIWNVVAAGSATVNSNGHGITINGAATAGGYKIYHNSINLNTDQASGTTAALNITSAVVAAGALDVRNNIFANTQTAGATRYSVHSAAASNVFSTINYNDYFSTGSVGFLGGIRATLAEWQAATGQDANSLAVDPLFVSPTDLHIQAGSPMVNAGTPVAEVTTDIDGDARSATTPDIGADEIVVGPSPGSLQFSSATYSGGEGGSPFTVTLTRTGGSAGSVSVGYATSDGTATGGAACTAGVDYVATSGTLTFADGVTSQTFDVVICDDSIVEADETFTYTLSNPTGGATIGTPGTAVQTIIDNDKGPLGTISIGDARVFEGKTGVVEAEFTVTFTGTGTASVNYSTADGTATAGVDYQATSGTVTFNPPALSEEGIPSHTQTITVAVNGDSVREANETFFVVLSNPTGATIADGIGAGIIVDDDRAYLADFDDDRVSDVSIYRPSENRWYTRRSTDASAEIVDQGAPGDIPVTGDYNGDSVADYAVYRPSTGQWIVALSGTQVTQTTTWGVAGDKPVQGDYDGDGKTDLAVFRPGTGEWWIRSSSSGSPIVIAFGLATDRLVQGDYDGDYKTDVAVYRDGTWYILLSSNASVRIQNWGLATDLPVSGDFDGDGSFDLAVFRDGDWWILNSLSGTFSSFPWGLPTDIPAPADYDGDGSTDVVVFRPSNGNWYVLRSSNGTTDGLNWGLAGDIPAASTVIHP